MAPAKAYFSVSDFDHTPDKHIKLGQIVLKPFVPDAAISPPHVPLPEVDTSFKDDWEKERSRTLSGSMGIWGKFLAWVFTLGADFSVNFEREDANVFKFAKLETNFFVPNNQYITDAMSSPEVKEYLSKHPKTGKMFMITGVKIAREAGITTKKVRGKGGEVDVSLNAMPTTVVPAEGGPNLVLQRRAVDSESFTKATDFVFAYRLRKIIIQRKTGDISSKDFTKNATYGVDVPKWKGGDESGSGSGDEEVEVLDGKMHFDILGDVGDFGATSDVPGFESEILEDEEEGECRMVFQH